MGVWLSFLVVVTVLVLVRRNADRRLAMLVGVDADALAGTYRGALAIASLDHLERDDPTTPHDVVESPYRRAGEVGRNERSPERRRAEAALLNARWLLLSAVEEAREAAALGQRGDRRASARRALAQSQAECEALQCVFEAEECLGTRIVRDPEEPRCFARFYGRAPELLDVVSTFCERAAAGEWALARRDCRGAAEAARW